MAKWSAIKRYIAADLKYWIQLNYACQDLSKKVQFINCVFHREIKYREIKVFRAGKRALHLKMGAFCYVQGKRAKK